MPSDTVGQKIQTLRKKMKMSQAQLADKIGVAPVTVSKWEIDTSKPKGPSLLRLSQLFNVPIDALVNDVSPLNQSREQVEIPFYPDIEVSAGGGCICEHEVKESYLIDKAFIDTPKTTIAMRVHGDSMVPVFQDDAVVFIDMEKNNVSDGKVYVVVHDGLTRMKLLEKIPNGLRLKSYNPTYPPEDIFFDQETIKVVGQIVAQIQKY
ncbi:helix-turn-helix transcriptional regulator [Vibrio coralliilyticus]|uniref:XRE family transcriptional regulator n=1 Tax=Vibrio TaxID=662 RepID=UPI00050410C0|nr:MULTISPECIES: helix-turn-helix transcriptional regulator [Vibrio]KFI12050.1 hypothetical protein IX95_10410 [Vibrio sp. B183]NOI21201.1 helix-turn-helix transcriptional regulator [Vibrio coralliilyticus]